MKLTNYLRWAVAAGVTALSAIAATPAHATDLLDTVKARGTLIVGIEGTYPPFNFVNTETRKLDGFDVDVARMLADKLGVKVKFVKTEWSAILAGLSSGKFDVIVNQVGITPKRKKTFAFPVPYVAWSPHMILRQDAPEQYKRDRKGGVEGKRV